MNQKTRHVGAGPVSAQQKGITLIALVITIIVLLILAGVTISMVLGDEGIIAQAQQASKAQKEAEGKDAIALAVAEAKTLKYANQDAMTKAELEALEFDFETVDYHNSVAKVTEDGVPIPVGFAHVQGTTKEEGLIVVDGYGNEFVWVPVENAIYDATTNPLGMFKYNSTTGNYSGKLYSWKSANVDEEGNWTVASEYTDRAQEPKLVLYSYSSNDENAKNLEAILEEKYLNADGEYTTDGLLAQFTAEYNAMAESIKAYGGFYVGRYETSWTGSRVASVGNVSPMTGATLLEETWATSKESNLNKATWYGLYAKQKELYNKESDSVVSGMIYGAQYDAIMNWMKDVKNPNVEGAYYIKNSTGMGNYKKADGTYKAIATGSNNNYKVKNIYDLAGNYYEWTQEKNSNGGVPFRVKRGGRYYSNASYYPASDRDTSTDESSYASDYASSRLQLYIK